MTKWYSAKEVPNYEEWILTEWYDGDDGGLKYETDYLYSFIYWKDYVKRNNITKWCYIKDIKDQTYERNMEASIGDHIIKDVNEEFYPCKPNIFAKTYEEITE